MEPGMMKTKKHHHQANFFQMGHILPFRN